MKAPDFPELFYFYDKTGMIIRRMSNDVDSPVYAENSPD